MTTLLEVRVLHGRTDRVNRLTREHGHLFDYLTHTALPHRPAAVLMGCRCEGGHGAARLPATFWVDQTEALLDLSRPQPQAEVSVLPVSSPLPMAA